MSSTGSTSALLYAASVTAPTTTSTRPVDEITKAKAWHEPGAFKNPWPSYVDQAGWKIGLTVALRYLTGKANKPDTTPPTVPVRSPTFLQSRYESSKMRVTWLGHACYYVEFPSGLRVLFDPVFTERCSPYTWLGPKRYTEMPCQIKDLPIIDAVVISHNHYDHLSLPTIEDISKRHPECHFLVPLGNKKWFDQGKIKNCTELDWWEEIDFTLIPDEHEKRAKVLSTDTSQPKGPASISARISCLPGQHGSGRTAFDRCKTLWASWAIKTGNENLYFAGDTAYRGVPRESEGKDDWSDEYSHLPRCPAFKDVGRILGPFDLGLIPIGAYAPRWIMSSIHANPRDAVEIFRDTQCKKALGMHWGTWVLTEEDVMEAPQQLKEALRLHSIPETGVFDVCDIGESREY